MFSRIIITALLLSIGMDTGEPPWTVTILFTGSANGVLESCFCPGNPFGGLVNRIAMLDSLRTVYPDAITVDVGDFLPIEPDSLKSAYVVHAMQECKYDAIVPGDQDFNLGIENLKNLGLPFIAASISDISTKATLFPTSNLIIRKNIKVKIIGLFEESLLQWSADSIKNAIHVEPVDSTWGKIKTDPEELVIVLSHRGYDRDTEFLNNVSGVDVLISGHSQMLIQQPEKHGDAVLVACGKNGEYVGLLRLQVHPDESVAVAEYRLIPLLSRTNIQSERVTQLVSEYNNQYNKRVKQAAIAAGRKYFGTDFCASCHESEHNQWTSTPHSHALETLKHVGKADNVSCLNCHTTGLGFPGGFIDEQSTPKQAGVGCEECHRIPPNTQFDPMGSHPVMAVAPQWCKRCHIPPHIIEFDYHKALKQVNHDE